MGVELKKAFGFDLVRKSYENKHVDGSGNFGFVLVKGKYDETKGLHQSRKWFSLAGDYGSDQQVIRIQFGGYIAAGEEMPVVTYEGLAAAIKEKMARMAKLEEEGAQ